MTSRCRWLKHPASATRTNGSGCDRDGTVASLSEAEIIRGPAPRRCGVDRVFGHYAVKPALKVELERRGLKIRESATGGSSFHVMDPDGFEVQMGGTDQ